MRIPDRFPRLGVQIEQHALGRERFSVRVR